MQRYTIPRVFCKKRPYFNISLTPKPPFSPGHWRTYTNQHDKNQNHKRPPWRQPRRWTSKRRKDSPSQHTHNARSQHQASVSQKQVRIHRQANPQPMIHARSSRKVPRAPVSTIALLSLQTSSSASPYRQRCHPFATSCIWRRPPCCLCLSRHSQAYRTSTLRSCRQD